jgi:hypothetical protein
MDKRAPRLANCALYMPPGRSGRKALNFRLCDWQKPRMQAWITGRWCFYRGVDGRSRCD